jgi:hypothetical protein
MRSSLRGNQQHAFNYVIIHSGDTYLSQYIIGDFPSPIKSAAILESGN